MNTPNTQWTDSIQSQLSSALKQASKLPAGETLYLEKLNNILNTLDEFKATFLMQCSVHGIRIHTLSELDPNKNN